MRLLEGFCQIKNCKSMEEKIETLHLIPISPGLISFIDYTSLLYIYKRECFFFNFLALTHFPQNKGK